MAEDPSAPTQPDSRHDGDVEGIRAAARWILGTAGAVATVLLAGFQVKDLGSPLGSERWWQVWLPVVFSVVAVAIVFDVFRLAARVLVPDRISADDLVRAEQKQAAEALGIQVRRGNDGGREIWRLAPDLVDSVHLARAWLLPEGCARVSDLMEAMEKAPATGRPRLEGNLRRVLRFCRLEIARRRYRQLVGAMTGLRGWLFIASLTGLAFVAGSQHRVSPTIDRPLRMTVVFSESPSVANEVRACAGRTVEGVAIGGTLALPVVVFDSGPCLGRLTVSEDVGTAIPIVDGQQGK